MRIEWPLNGMPEFAAGENYEWKLDKRERERERERERGFRAKEEQHQDWKYLYVR